mgnify:CR=1 FL=1
MSNIEHLLENGLIAADKANKIGKDPREAFYQEMSALYNKCMLTVTQIKEDDLWEIVQYVLFTWENGE